MRKNGEFKTWAVDDKRVIAKLRGALSVEDEVEKHCSKTTHQLVVGIDAFVDKLNGLAEWQKIFTGVAVKMPADKYDLEFGERIAKKKAILKYQHYMVRKYGKLLEILKQACVEIEKLYDKHYDKLIKEDNDYYNLCGYSEDSKESD